MFEQIKSQLSASGFSILTSLIDQNNYAHGKHANKLSILSPNEVNITGKNIWFGINPSIAKNVAAEFFSNKNVNSYHCLGN